MTDSKLLPSALSWKYGAETSATIYKDGTFEIMSWKHDTESQPSVEQCILDIEEYEAHLALTDYKEKRKVKYKDSSDSLFMEWQYLLCIGAVQQDIDNAKQVWLDVVDIIKAEIPKP